MQKVSIKQFYQHMYAEKPVKVENKQLIKLRECGTKRAFATRLEATQIAEKMTRNKNCEFHSYLCNFCNFFHIGHVQKKNSK